MLTIPFTATDENGATSASADLVITITGTNDVPVAQAAVAAVAEDAIVNGNVTATDADAGETATLTYRAGERGAGGADVQSRRQLQLRCLELRLAERR